MKFSPHKRFDPGFPLAGTLMADGRPSAPLGSRHGRGWVGEGGHTYSFVDTAEGPLLYRWDGHSAWLPYTERWQSILQHLGGAVIRREENTQLQESLRAKAMNLVVESQTEQS